MYQTVTSPNSVPQIACIDVASTATDSTGSCMTAQLTTQVIEAGGRAIEAAARVLARGGLVAFPTETVYGLGADAGNDEAVSTFTRQRAAPRSIR